MRRNGLRVFRALFGLALLGGVMLWLRPRDLLHALAGVEGLALAGAVGLQVLAKALWTARWRVVLRAGGLERGFWDLLGVLHVGLFFSTFLPTNVGGDLVRGYYTSREPGELATSYVAVVVERALGFLALTLLAAIACGAMLALGSDLLPPPVLVTITLAAGLTTVVGLLTLTWRPWLAWAKRTLRRSARLCPVAEAVDLLRRPEAHRGRILLYTLSQKVNAVLFLAVCALAVGLHLPLAYFFIVVPVAGIAALLPVTLNGLGVREGVLVALLSAFGAPAALAGAAAVLALAINTAFALLGGVVYAVYRPPPAPLPASQAPAGWPGAASAR